MAVFAIYHKMFVGSKDLYKFFNTKEETEEQVSLLALSDNITKRLPDIKLEEWNNE